MENSKLRVYLAHGDEAARKVIEATLALLSHRVELSTATPAVLFRRCEENPPDIAIVGTEFEGDDVFTVVNQLCDRAHCPVVALIRREDVDRSNRLITNDVMGILVQPVTENDLRPAIYLAKRRFQQSVEMQNRVSSLEQAILDVDRDLND